MNIAVVDAGNNLTAFVRQLSGCGFIRLTTHVTMVRVAQLRENSGGRVAVFGGDRSVATPTSD